MLIVLNEFVIVLVMQKLMVDLFLSYVSYFNY